MPIIIVGAGMAGLLAARMLARHSPLIYEKAPSLPHNHSAVLRFASSKVADVLGIPFRKVNMTKTVVPWRNPVADAMQYSHKVLGKYRSDRSVLLPERWVSQERWIAPPNLIEQMAEGVKIEYGVDFGFQHGAKVISTIPMPVLARKLGHDRDLGWHWVKGINVRASVLNCDAYVSVMIPDPEVPFYRVSLTGAEMIVEMAYDVLSMDTAPMEIARRACEYVGISPSQVTFASVKKQDYGKIAPIDEGERKNFIYWASTITGRAYQLGRYATWRPRLLLDDLVEDVRLIERWMLSPSPAYDQEQHHHQGGHYGVRK